MAESATEESPAQRAARLRREKREKKLAEGGSDRLARITNASGRVEDLQPGHPPRPTVADDPAEVDISYLPPVVKAPSNGPLPDDAARLRAALRAPLPQGQQSGTGSGPDASDDPMIQLMQQMQQMLGSLPGVGGAAGPGGAGPGGSEAPGLPPALAALLSGQPPPGGQAQAEQAQAPAVGTNVWRVVHVLFALGLALYIVLTIPFTGTEAERLSFMAAPAQDFFKIFATIELMLQGSRYFLEKGSPPQGGMIVTVASFLPEPYKSRLLVFMRYIGMLMTLIEDALVVVFTLGLVAWWRGEV